MTAQKLEFQAEGIDKQEIIFNADVNLISIILGEIFEEEIYKSLLEAVKGVKKPVIIDIGAHIGLASIYFTKSKGTIHAIEPNPNNYAMLKHNTKKYPQIKPHMVAIGAMNNKRKLKATEEHDPESFYADGEGIDVNTVTLKTFMELNKIKHVDALKVDCEGAEYEIFLMPEFKKVSKKIDFIVGEAHYKPSIPQMIPAMLEPLGYKVKFLPFKNLTESYSITFKDGTKHEVTAELNTMFVAQR